MVRVLTACSITCMVAASYARHSLTPASSSCGCRGRSRTHTSMCEASRSGPGKSMLPERLRRSRPLAPCRPPAVGQPGPAKRGAGVGAGVGGGCAGGGAGRGAGRLGTARRRPPGSWCTWAVLRHSGLGKAGPRGVEGGKGGSAHSPAPATPARTRRRPGPGPRTRPAARRPAVPAVPARPAAWPAPAFPLRGGHPAPTRHTCNLVMGGWLRGAWLPASGRRSERRGYGPRILGPGEPRAAGEPRSESHSFIQPPKSVEVLGGPSGGPFTQTKFLLFPPGPPPLSDRVGPGRAAPPMCTVGGAPAT